MIEADGSDRNDGEDGRCNARGDHPRRKRSIDKSLHSGPAREKRVAPKTDRRQMIAVNRATDHFGNHVIRSAETDRAEPEKEQVIRVPPADSRLQDALHWHDK